MHSYMKRKFMEAEMEKPPQGCSEPLTLNPPQSQSHGQGKGQNSVQVQNLHLVSVASSEKEKGRQVPSFMNLPLQFTSDSFGDTVLKLEDKQIRVHKDILAFWSSKFQEILEKDDTELTEKWTDFEIFLTKIYPPCTLPITIHNVKPLLQISHKYQVYQLEFQCIEALKTMAPSMYICLLADAFNEKFGKELLANCIDWMAQNFESIRESREFEGLSKDTILRVLQEQKKSVVKKRRLSFICLPSK
eukprot:TRINITY_DN1734_c0_g1_i1.p1 TRINITY_DN1734_c0_g1~~TRINITY_DN1734_c0_g1_i1.p1  ORF type:complete len:246 (+),score=41.51 TRINITY_DN1734_c0_g1_i1:572-1309(+)